MSHPSAGQLEAAAFGWLSEAEAQQIRAHAASCPQCGPAVREEETVRRRLGLLRGGEPRIEVAQRVLEQLGRMPLKRRVVRPGRLAMVAMLLVAAGLLVASNGHLRRTMKRFGAMIA